MKLAIKRVVILSFLFFMLVSVVAVMSVKQILEYQLPLPTSTLLTVDKGTSATKFIKQLTQLGWLESDFWLKVYLKVFPQYSLIKAGTYQVPAQISIKELFLLLVEGKEHQFTVTFIEGSTFKDILTQLTTVEHITHTITDLAIEDVSKTIGIKQANPEGWLFPDTYAFTAGTKDITILKRAYLQMNERFEFLWQKRTQGLPYQTRYEALIMASIIEKETSHIPEQPTIAGVFVNRLRTKMRLQTDPTVIYGLGDRYQGDITRAHLREKTLYNTYRINGLPPTPIAMPGLSAIEAALNPATTDYFYFVSQGNGQHTFSKTLKEHNVAVRLYLKNQKLKNSQNDSAELN